MHPGINKSRSQSIAGRWRSITLGVCAAALLSIASLFAQSITVLPLVGSCSTADTSSDAPKCLWVEGDYAYVGDYDLEIVGVSDPAHPFRVGQYDRSWSAAFFKVGNLGYVGGYDGLQILDLSNPANVVPLGSYDDCRVYSVTVQGDYAYLAAGSGDGVHIADVSNPASPVRVAQVLNGQDIRALDVKDDHLYATHYGGSLEIFDVTRPTAPVFQGTYSGSFYNVHVAKHVAYVVDWDGLQLIDVTDPSQPAPLRTWPGVDRSSRVVAAEGYAYVTDRNQALLVLDVSDPEQPVAVAGYPGWGVDVCVQDRFVYVADKYEGLLVLQLPQGLQILNEPSDQRVVAGQSATLQVAVFGPTPIQYQWYQGMAGDTSRPVEGAVSPMLTTEPLWETSSYWVRASHADTTIDSRCARITLLPPVTLREVGKWPGYRRDRFGGALVAAGDYAYLTAGGGLRVIDIRNPQGPQDIGGIETLSAAIAVDLADGLLVMAGTRDNTAWLETVDVSDPTRPSSLGRYQTLGETQAVCRRGCLAYLATRELNTSVYRATLHLYVVDISQPAQPVLVTELSLGTYDVPWNSHLLKTIAGMDVQGDYLYMAMMDRLSVFDLSVPGQPVPVGTGFAPRYGLAQALCLAGDKAYMSMTQECFDMGNRETDVVIFDITNPGQPSLLSSYSTEGGIRGIAVEGGYALIAFGDLWDDIGGSFQILDVSDPAVPSLFVDLGPRRDMGQITDLCRVGDRLFAADAFAGLEVYDVGDFTQPEWVGECDVCGRAADIAVAGDYAFMLDDSRDLEVIDIRQPAEPARVGAYHGHLTTVSRLEIEGTRAYVTGGRWVAPDDFASGSGHYYDGLTVVDVTNPEQPRQLAVLGSEGRGRDVTVSGDYAYLYTSNPYGVSVVWIGDLPWGMTPYFSLASPRGPIAAASGYGYVADRERGVQVVDFSNPFGPVQVATCDTPGSATDIDAVGEVAYVADGPGGLQVIDVAEPVNPQIMAWCDLAKEVTSVFADQRRAYLIDEDGDVQVVDVAEPNQPAWVGSYDPPGRAQRVVAVGNEVYIADDAWGLLLLDLAPALILYPSVRVGDSISLRWAGGPGIVLQESAELREGVWLDVPNSEGVSELELPTSASGRFFRLKAH